jgi:crossover junction endodeoxyribonuclease RuvC
MDYITTDAKAQTHGLRADIIESWATLFIAKHANKGFTYITREDFQGQSSAQNYPVFAAWSGCERAVEKFGFKFDKFTYTQKNGRKRTSLGVSPSQVKLLVTGNGKADKDEVADAVRRLTGFTGEFAVNDLSDSAAIGLAFLINEGVVKT